jgi:predicted AlkP superfamily pyrophosphatase or phosphodiesterase
MPRRFILAFAFLLAFLPAARSEPPAKPKLAVLIVFDQMRGDYLIRWQDLFASDGFRRLQTGGAWFDNCHYPYAMTATGPGHASMLSGCSPDTHGIVANEWYDRKAAAKVNCANSDRYERIPPAPKTTTAPAETKKDTDEEAKVKGVGAPVWMLAPTLGDALKEATGGRGKVFGLSLKDRSALLPAGKHPDGCYWFEKGQFVTTTYYRDRLHPWVARFNEGKSFDRWFGTSWERLRPDLDYTKLAGRDAGPGEDKVYNQGVVFPHPFGKAAKIGGEYYSALANSPFGNQVLFELARTAIHEEQLGKRDVPDLLVVSFSSNDLIGHAFGPDSHEVLDVTLRCDLIVRDFLRFLDEHVGKGNYVLGLTADHGVCPLPEATRAAGKPADRVMVRALLAEAEAHLQQVFGEPGDAGRWIEAGNEAGAYLNERLIKARGKSLDAVANELAAFFRSKPFVQNAYTRSQLEGEPRDDLMRMVKKSFRAERSGDVLWMPSPYYLITSRKLGTGHGTPHPYDTHVPLLFFGAGVKPGRRSDAVTPQALAATLAKALGIPAPAKAEAPVPTGLFE